MWLLILPEMWKIDSNMTTMRHLNVCIGCLLMNVWRYWLQSGWFLARNYCDLTSNKWDLLKSISYEIVVWWLDACQYNVPLIAFHIKRNKCLFQKRMRVAIGKMVVVVTTPNHRMQNWKIKGETNWKFISRKTRTENKRNKQYKCEMSLASAGTYTLIIRIQLFAFLNNAMEFVWWNFNFTVCNELRSISYITMCQCLCIIMNFVECSVLFPWLSVCWI